MQQQQSTITLEIQHQPSKTTPQKMQKTKTTTYLLLTSIIFPMLPIKSTMSAPNQPNGTINNTIKKAYQTTSKHRKHTKYINNKTNKINPQAKYLQEICQHQQPKTIPADLHRQGNIQHSKSNKMHKQRTQINLQQI